MKKPNLFIVGAPKSGSTFLYDKLKNHKSLFFPKIKELNYFSYNNLKKESYYKDYKINNLNKYLSYYRKASTEDYLVDSSVSYFIFDEIPIEIKKFNKDAKIIIIIRDPYKRAFSHYLMDRRMGFAPKSFTEYLKDENSFHFRQYVHNSLYYKQISKYIEHFGKRNILILELESLRTNFNSIFKFLNIECIEVNFDDRINENKTAKNLLGKIVLRQRGIVERIKLLIPDEFLKFSKRFLYNKAVKGELETDDMNLLKFYLENDFSKFKSLINGN